MAKARLKSKIREMVRIEARRAFYVPHLRAQSRHTRYTNTQMFRALT